MFTINKDGQIKTAKGLDRESKAVYELTIRATDRGGKGKIIHQQFVLNGLVFLRIQSSKCSLSFKVTWSTDLLCVVMARWGRNPSATIRFSEDKTSCLVFF